MGGIVWFLPIGDLSSRSAAAWTVGGAAGILYAHRWLWELLPKVTHLSTVSIAGLLLLAATGLALFHLSLLSAVRRLPAPAVVVAGAATMAIAEAILTRLLPWTFPVSLGWVGGGIFGAFGSLAAGGPALVGLLVGMFVAGAVRRSPLEAAGSLVAWVLLALAAVSPSARRADAATEGVGSLLTISGVLPPTIEGTPDWREAQVEAMIDAEGASGADVVVWPEAAYPYSERPGREWTPSRLPPPVGRWRIFGAHLLGQHGKYRNVVAAQGPGSKSVSIRDKHTLAPVREPLLVDPGEGRLVLDVAGRRVALPICYELLDQSLFDRQEFDLVVSVSSDQFDPTGETAAVLARAAWLRSLTSRVPVVRVSDSAHEVVFDELGRPVEPERTGSGGAVYVLYVGRGGEE